MRPFQTAFPPEFLQSYQYGVLHYRYRGVPCLKSPIDLAIYMQAIWDLRPGALIEIGTQAGGSALWFADILSTYGYNCPVVTIDIAPPDGIEDARIRFLQGDVLDLGAVFDAQGLAALPRPWMVVEDSAHTYAGCLAALGYLSDAMAGGDLLVMEDGNLVEMGLSEHYDGGPNRAIAEFMAVHPDAFAVETGYCDMFGPNATYSPNAYLRKT